MQESGVPNVSGSISVECGVNTRTGAFYSSRSSPRGSITGNQDDYININNSRSSSQYQNNLNEVRVKSIISNGYIRIF